MPPSYQDTINQKRQATTQTNKEQSELQAMVRQMQQIQAAALAGAAGKSTVILTDQTDLGDKIKDLTTTLTGAVKSTDTTELTKDQTRELKALQAGLDKLTRVLESKKQDNSDIIAALRDLDLHVEAPVVNVPQPKVTVQAAKLDLTPLNNTLKQYFEAPKDSKLDLDCYRAQDITDDGDIQYVGFLNADGEWYIIENNVPANKMRYVFGTSGYAKAFAKAAQYEYKLLNEAVNSATA